MKKKYILTDQEKDQAVRNAQIADGITPDDAKRDKGKRPQPGPTKAEVEARIWAILNA